MAVDLEGGDVYHRDDLVVPGYGFSRSIFMMLSRPHRYS
jgi:hypothetical protein